MMDPRIETGKNLQPLEPVGALNATERENLILEYAPLVKRIAYRIVSRLPDTIQVEDLISIGTLGLIDAVEKYDPEKSKGFRAYAELRIKGAILDELRGYDSLSRANRRRANRLEQAVELMQHTLGHKPNDEELANFLKVDIEELHEMRHATRSVVFLDIDDPDYSSQREAEITAAPLDFHEDFEPFRQLADKSMKDRLAAGIQRLDEKLKLVLQLYYYSELNYKEIGEIMGLSESRISQLHTKAVGKLRKILASQEF